MLLRANDFSFSLSSFFLYGQKVEYLKGVLITKTLVRKMIEFE